MHRKDIEVLRHIASHPVFRHFVKELVYNGVRFSGPTLKCLKDSCDPNVEYYQKRYEEEQSVLKDNSNYCEIAAALTHLPNLQRVVFTNHWLPTRDLLGNCSLEERRRGAPSPKGARLAGPLSREYPAGLIEPDGTPIETRDNYSGYRYIDYGFLRMSWALGITKPHVQWLVIDYYRHPPPSGVTCRASGIHSNTFGLLYPDLQRYFDFFRHLRKICFTIEGPNTGPQNNVFCEGKLGNLLASAHHLEDLTFDFGTGFYKPEYWGGAAYLPLAVYLGGPHSWPCLRLLRLYSQVSTEAELSGLIQRHSKSLEVLHPEGIMFAEGTWQEAADKWHKQLHLEEIACHRLSEHRQGELVVNTVKCDEFEKYIMDGTSGPIWTRAWPLDSLKTKFRL